MGDVDRISVEVIVNTGIEEAWNEFTNPESIKKWNFASDDWICPKAVNDIKNGGEFNYRMESRDGKYGFDSGGRFERINKLKNIEYIIGDGRRVIVTFENIDGKTKITEVFEKESQNSAELQRSGWQAILNNYKKYIEGKSQKDSI